MSEHYRRDSYVSAWREINKRAAEEIDGARPTAEGEPRLKAMRVLVKFFDPKKVRIGWFQRRVLRGEVKPFRRPGQ